MMMTMKIMTMKMVTRMVILVLIVSMNHLSQRESLFFEMIKVEIDRLMEIMLILNGSSISVC